MSALSDGFAVVREEIDRAARRAGRRAEEVSLVAVSKTHPPEALREAWEVAGQLVFGESRVQEAKAKAGLLPEKFRWHFIGHLQKNKVRAALPLFERFHGIDSLELAAEVNRVAAAGGFHPRVLLEVNVAGEGTKFGFTPDGLRAGLEEVLALDRLQVDGLMAMAPFHPEPEHSRPFFARLRTLRDELARAGGVGLPELSMGMSGDYGVAVEEGATLVRVGTALFGPRTGKAWRPVGGSAED